MPKADTLRKSLTHLRAPVARGLKGGEKPIDRDGGDYGAGIIRGFAVVTRGEALGHDMWIDGDFLQQVADAINHRKLGIKSRFTHPGLSSDGMGKLLARAKDAYVEGDVTRADMHFLESAHKTPDGDLATYVMDLAEEDSKAFGTSIVFQHDEQAEAEFEADNHTVDGFASPDPNNKQNFPHARLNELRAVDAVDEPAANPTGMFHRGQDLAEEAWDFARFATGLTDALPKVAELDINPTRFRAFVARFLEKEGLQLMPKSKLNDGTATEPAPVASAAPTENAPAEVVAPVVAKTPEDEEEAADEAAGTAAPAVTQHAAKTGKDYLDAFGDKGGVWFAEGKSFDECQALYLKAMKDENAELKKRLGQVKGGEVTAPAFSGTEPRADDKKFNRLQQQLGEAGARFAASIVLPAKQSMN